jgi:hypothetical protein
MEDQRVMEHEGKKNGMDYNGGIATKPAKQKQKQTSDNKNQKRLCPHCSRNDHVRLSSKQCPLNKKYDRPDKDDVQWVSAREAIAAKASVAVAAAAAAK